MMFRGLQWSIFRTSSRMTSAQRATICNSTACKEIPRNPKIESQRPIAPELLSTHPLPPFPPPPRPPGPWNW